MNDVACKTLADRFEDKRRAGLVDVKFLLRNSEEASIEEVCEEVSNFYAAIDNGQAKPLDFGDMRWNEAGLTAR